MDISEALKIKNPADLKRHPWEVARRDIVRYFLIMQKGFPFAHVADVGCGDGYILKHLLKTNAARYFSAIDPFFTDDIIKELKAIPKAENIRFYNDVSELNDSPLFDCVLLLDVLEHVPDDEELILEVRRSAARAKGATWIITVPAFQGLFSNHDTLLKHCRRYNLNQLLVLCKKCGLIVDKRGYFFFSLIPLRIIQILSQALFKKEKKNTIENWNGGKILSAILRSTLWIDFKMSLLLSNFGMNIPGLSCYCICH